MKLTGANELTGAEDLLFDGHAHVFESDLLMMPDRRYTPGYDAKLECYSRILIASGLTGAILVQPSFLGTDNSYLIKTIKHSKGNDDLRFYGVAVIDSGFTSTQLKRYADQGIIGIRLNLVGRPLLNDDQLRQWRPIFDTLNSLGWHVELHCEGNRLTHILPKLLDRCDRVVLDHFGLPTPQGDLACAGQKLILNCPRDQVFIKVSAPYRIYPDLQTHDAALLCKKYFTPLLDYFGPSQLIWGSDWPWTQFENRHSYHETLEWLNLLLAPDG